jgi:ABC-2 type transport system ATP-binding protein
MSNLVCEVKDLNLVYKVRTHLSRTTRDLFIATARNPLESILRQPDRKHVLKDVSFQIHKGDRIALLGVNGAGKTSLCRILSGVMRPTRGSLKLPAETRALFQTSMCMYPELTGRENVECLIELLYPLHSREQQKVLLQDVIDFSDLGAETELPFQTYSAGMQARLMLSLATVQPAELLILDEVFDGADVFWRKKFSKRMSKFIEDSGSMIFVSHTSDLLKLVCNKSILLSDGRLHCFESVEAGLEAYERIHSAQGPLTT